MRRTILAALLAAAVALAACDETDTPVASEATDTAEAAIAAEPADEAAPAEPAPISAEGRALFQQRCGACHVANAEQNRVGPHLVALFGRTAGTVVGFRYSDAMTGSGIVWSDETLTAYLTAPRSYIPGNRMAFAGLARAGDIDAVLDYLRVATAPARD